MTEFRRLPVDDASGEMMSANLTIGENTGVVRPVEVGEVTSEGQGDSARVEVTFGE